MDLDTKWKNVRESRWFKALCVVLSMVLAFSSVALLSAVMRVSGLYNDDAFTDPSVAKKGSLVQTTIFKAELDVIVNEIALLAGQKQLQQKVAALKKAKADSVAAALEQYKKDQATAIRKTLVFYAGLKNQNITNIGKDIPNYKVPTKTIKKVVAEDRDAPGLIRDLQQIVNGTRAGEDYLPYLQLANWLRSSDGVEYYNDSDMQDDPEDLTDYYTVAFTVDGQTVSADMYDDDLTLGETIKSAETHIKKLYDKAVVKRFQFAADEQQKMRQNLQELQCLQFYAKDNITGQVVSQLPEGQTPAMLKDAPVYYSKTKAGENLRGTDYGADNARSDAAQYLMDGDMSISVGIECLVHPYAKYEYRGDDRGGCLPGGAGPCLFGVGVPGLRAPCRYGRRAPAVDGLYSLGIAHGDHRSCCFGTGLLTVRGLVYRPVPLLRLPDEYLEFWLAVLSGLRRFWRGGLGAVCRVDPVFCAPLQV